MNEPKQFSATDATKTARFEQLALGQNIQAKSGMATDNKWYRRLLALPAYYWVLIAQIAVVLPHAAHLPIWLIGFAAISIIAQLPRLESAKKTLAFKTCLSKHADAGFFIRPSGSVANV